MNKKFLKLFENETYWIITLLSLFLIYFIIILIHTEGYVGGADSLTHYRFSRYSWLYPEFLLHHWAKPVFTLVSSPFAQFGHVGVSVFNILCGMASTFFAWLSAKKLGYSNRFLIPFLLLFMPVYALNILSGLTEVFFGLFIIVAVYLSLNKKYLWAAIVISFSHLVRTEGIIIIPILGLYLLIIKQYRTIPFLFTGTVIYSIIGYFHFGDIFWLITQMPYTGAKDLYGTGSLTHFFELSPKLFGGFSVFLMVIGFITISIQLIVKKKQNNIDEFVLVFLPFIMYFLAHTIMWWSGIGNSLGMHRYVVAIVPVGALLSLRGFNIIYDLVNKLLHNKIAGYILMGLFIYFISEQPYVRNPYYPPKMFGMDLVMHEASQYILENDLDENKIYYYDPAFLYFIDFNPFDPQQAREFVYKPDIPQYKIEKDEIVIWDGHFSPLLGLYLDSLRVNPYFNEMAEFNPDEPFKVFDTDYKVVLFQRNDKPFFEE